MDKILKIVFVALFFIVSGYIVFIQTQKYESSTIVTIKNLAKNQEVSLGAMILGQGSEVVKDSNVLQLFIRSYEMFEHLDSKFHLKAYYTSKAIDPLHRLYSNGRIGYFELNKENLLQRYNDDLQLSFDMLSETLTIRFAHANSREAQAIVKEIISYADQTINKIERESTEVSLRFIEKLADENRRKLIKAIRQMIIYQNKQKTFDPELDVQRIVSILAELQAEQTKKEVEYQSKKTTGWNINSIEMKTLQASIENIKRSIRKLKQELSGGNGKQELNVNVFEFQVLKNDLEFAKEVYRQTLINLEKLKMEVRQNTRHLVVIAPPYLPDDYRYPEKLRDVLVVLIALGLLYILIRSVTAILREHVD